MLNIDLYARELLSIWEKFEKFQNFLQHLLLCFNGSQRKLKTHIQNKTAAPAEERVFNSFNPRHTRFIIWLGDIYRCSLKGKLGKKDYRLKVFISPKLNK